MIPNPNYNNYVSSYAYQLFGFNQFTQGKTRNASDIAFITYACYNGDVISCPLSFQKGFYLYGSFSIGVWVRIICPIFCGNSRPDQYLLLESGDASSNQNTQVKFGVEYSTGFNLPYLGTKASDGSYKQFGSQSDLNGGIALSGSASLTTVVYNQWSYIAASYDQVTGVVTLYSNGIQAFESSPHYLDPVVIAGYPSSPSTNGQSGIVQFDFFDELRFFNYAVDQSTLVTSSTNYQVCRRNFLFFLSQMYALKSRLQVS